MADGIRTPDLPSASLFDEMVAGRDAGAGMETVRVARAAVVAQLGSELQLSTALLPVQTRTLATPPGSPTTGQAWIVAASPTGAWSGKVNNIARWTGSAWQFIVPTNGVMAFVIDEFIAYAWDSGSSAWEAAWSGGWTVRGAWSSATSYIIGDVVSRLGSSYRAISPSTNVAPESDSLIWFQFASKGATGDPGVDGVDGAIGAFGVGRIYPTEAAGLSNGVAGLRSVVPGSGGTDGVYPLAFSGGGGADADGYFVVSGGGVTDWQIEFPGYNYASAPAVSFASCPGLTGASATAVLRLNAKLNSYFGTTSSVVGEAVKIYQNVSGVATFSKALLSTEAFDFSYTPLTGYSYAIVDQQGRLALGIKSNGEVVAPATPVLGAVIDTPEAMSEVAWAVTDADDRFALGVGMDGDLIHKSVRGIDLGSLWLSSSAIVATNVKECQGDSLTKGDTVGVTTPYPAALAALLPGQTVNNRGVTGRTSLQIATAFGAVPSILTVASNTIPASGAVSVTLTENGNFSSRANLGTINTIGTLDGIEGTLAVAFNAGSPSLPGTSTFTRTASGSAKVIPNRCPFIPTTSSRENNTNIIWVGRNDIIAGVANSDILANIAAMVAFMPAVQKRFVILSVTDAASEPSGSAAHTQILALNYELSRLYPRNFIDVRKILVNSYNSGSAPDVAAFAADQVPPSLQQDGLHLNDAGYAIVAQAVATFLTSKGW